jgi:hypothetical protein
MTFLSATTYSLFAFAASIFLSAALTAAEPIVLFNGKDLTGWEGQSGLWTVENGVIVGLTTKEKPTKGNTFLFWRGGEMEDGELTFSVRLVDTKNNSGIMYRGKELPNFVSSGYQCDVNAGAENMAKLYDEKGRGRVCMAGEAVVWDKSDDGKYGKKENKPVCTPEQLKAAQRNDWNEIRIVAKGNHVEHYLNGVKILDFTDNEEEKRSKKGVIALQIHAGAPMRVEFKDLLLTPR